MRHQITPSYPTAYSVALLKQENWFYFTDAAYTQDTQNESLKMKHKK